MSNHRWFFALILAIAAFETNRSALAETAATGYLAELTQKPQDGGARRWQVVNPSGAVSFKKPGTAAPGDVHPPSAVLSNFGCVEEGAALWCEVQPLHGGPRAFVAAADLGSVAGPDGIVATGIDDSAKRAKRKRFDVTADIPCAQEQGQALAPCPVGVSRSDGGDVTAAVTFPAGFTRLLFFMHGEFISAAATMSGAGRDTEWRRVGDLHLIRADDQRFEIPHSLLFGE